MPRSPSHHAICARCVCDKHRRVAFAPARGDHRDVAIRDAPNRVDDFEYRMTGPGAQIEHAGIATIAKMVKRTHMRVAKVGDMDIVANRRPVLSRIVSTENAQRWA